MKHVLLLLLFFICAMPAARAQDWQTVPRRDTLYFAAGTHAGMPGSPVSTDSGLLRAVCIVAARAADADSVYEFPTGVRDTSQGSVSWPRPCLDTASPSWLGARMLRSPDGLERYFNRRGDTIFIQTKAAAGASWTLARDRAGRVFQGRITAAATAAIDGTTDSIKTLSIQAYANGVPVAHWYNRMVLQWSKHHGWIQTLDFYQFPEIVPGWDGGGLGFDSTQHRRLPASLTNLPFGAPDQDWVYQPGNEWIMERYTAFNTNVSNPANISKLIVHDSIIRVTPLTAALLIVEHRQNRYTETAQQSGPPIRTAVSALVADTLYRSSGGASGLEAMLRAGLTEQVDVRYFADSFCSGRYIVNRHVMRGADRTVRTAFCLQVMPGISGLNLSRSSYLMGFGNIGFYHLSGDDPSRSVYSEMITSYLKLGDCTRGTKVNVLTLDVSGPGQPLASVSVYPNPADDMLRIDLASASRPATITLRNLAGAVLAQSVQTGAQGRLRTADYPAGMYFVEVHQGNAAKHFRIVVRH